MTTDPLAKPEGYGVKVDQTPRPDWLGHDTHTVCDIVANGVTCTNPRTRVVWLGCINEHLGPICTCDDCYAMIVKYVRSGHMQCGLCANAPKPYKQLQYMQLVKDEAAPEKGN